MQVVRHILLLQLEVNPLCLLLVVAKPEAGLGVALPMYEQDTGQWQQLTSHLSFLECIIKAHVDPYTWS